MTKAKVLLVENSSIVLQIEKRYLKNEAVAIFAATDAEEGLATARKVRPDLVYLAFTLPGTDGAACCRALKSDPELAKIPVVMVANATDEEFELCRSAGCDAVITRPVDRREFLDAGRSYLAGVRLRNERTPCRPIAACSLNGATFYGIIEDISSSGMYLGSFHEVAPGDLLNVKFILPWSGAALVEARARVAWLNSGQQRRKFRLPAGFGVLFHELTTEAEEQIKDYVEFFRMRLATGQLTSPR